MVNGLAQAQQPARQGYAAINNNPQAQGMQGQAPAAQRNPMTTAAGNPNAATDSPVQTQSPLAQPKTDTVTILGKEVKKRTLFTGLAIAALAIGAAALGKFRDKTPGCVKKAISEAESMQTAADEIQKRAGSLIDTFNKKCSEIQSIFDNGEVTLENGNFKVKIEDGLEGAGKIMNEYAEDGKTILRTSTFYPDDENKFSLMNFIEFLEDSKKNIYSVPTTQRGNYSYVEGIETLLDKEGNACATKEAHGLKWLPNGSTTYYENLQQANGAEHYEKIYQNLPNGISFYQEGRSGIADGAPANIEKQILMKNDTLSSYSADIKYQNGTEITNTNLTYKNGTPNCYNKYLVDTPGRDAKAEKTLRRTSDDKWIDTAY